MYLISNQLSRTVNWHFTSRCNMSCRYCFVPHCDEVSLFDSFIILERQRPYFSRINFVGGEPTCSTKLISLVRKAKELGFIVSMVTNGYRLYHDHEFFDSIIQYFSIIGVSIDSLRNDVNTKIGRKVGSSVLSKTEYIDLCKKIKKSNCLVKINTVVSKLNCDEDFNDFYAQVLPARIKVFQVLKPSFKLKNDYNDLLITDEQFQTFVERHSQFKNLICCEDNELMLNSYYMMNGEGCFLDNKTGKVGKSLLSCEIDEALKGICVDMQKYSRRYCKAWSAHTQLRQ